MRHAAGLSSQPLLSSRWMSRSPFFKSFCVSLLLHAVVVFAMYAWPRRSTDSFTIAGRRHVLHLQFTSVQAPPVHVVAEPERLESNTPRSVPHADLPRPPEPPLRSVAPPQRMPKIALELPAVADTPAQSVGLPETTAYQKSRTPPKLPEVQIVPRESSRRITRHPTSPPPVQPPSVPPQDPIGLDEKVPPDMSSNPFPAYPAEAVRLRLEGTVLLRLRIDTDGRVQQVEIAKSSGHALLDVSAAEAVGSWRGEPAQRGGRPVATTELLPVRFRL